MGGGGTTGGGPGGGGGGGGGLGPIGGLLGTILGSTAGVGACKPAAAPGARGRGAVDWAPSVAFWARSWVRRRPGGPTRRTETGCAGRHPVSLFVPWAAVRGGEWERPA